MSGALVLRALGVSLLAVALGLGLGPMSNDLLGAAILGLGALFIVPISVVGPGLAPRLEAALLHGAWMAGAFGLGLGLRRPLDAAIFVLVDAGLLALAERRRGRVGSAGPDARAAASAAALLLLLTPGGAFAADESCPPQAPLFGYGRVPPNNLAVASMRRFAFESEAHRSDAVVVLRDGDLVFESYANGFDAQTPHLTWSVSKSVSSALLGVAVREGRVDLDDSICEHLEAPEDKCGITVLDLLRWSSGLEWTETYEEHESTQISSVIAMLYGEGRHAMTDFVLSHPLRAKPGETWMYSSGDAHLMMAVVRAAMAPAHGPLFPWPALFEPLMMEGAVFERDGAGDYAGASYFYGTARDLARFGQLYLQDGCWDGARLLPEGWVAAAKEVSAPFLRKRVGRGSKDVGGRSWWLNKAVPEAGIETPWPSLPEDVLIARGHWGQYLIVAPRQRVVAVRFGEDREGRRFDLDRFGALALQVAGVLP